MTFKYSFISKTLQIKQCDFASVKGILHQKNFYCLNLIFWKIMGCGIADYQGPRGTAPNDKSLKSFISGAAPRNPLALPLETPAPPLETPWRCASKPQVHRASKPLGTNFETKIFKFRWFLGPSDQNELYHTPLLSKI